MKTKKFALFLLLTTILLAAAQLASAITYVLDTNATSISNPATSYAGWNITVGITGNVTINATTLPNATATRFSWRNCGNTSDVVTGAITNEKVGFTTTVTAGNCYILLSHSNGASHNYWIGNTAITMPVVGGVINLSTCDDPTGSGDTPPLVPVTAGQLMRAFRNISITIDSTDNAQLYNNYTITPQSPTTFYPGSQTNFSIQYNTTTFRGIINSTLYLNNVAYLMHNDTANDFTVGINSLPVGTYNVTIQVLNGTTPLMTTINFTSYTINPFLITNCSDMEQTPYVLMNTTFKNVVTLASINATTNTLITFHYENITNNVLFSQAYTNIAGWQVCSNAIPVTANGNVEYQDVNANFSSNNYAFVNSIISTPQYLTLYLIPSSTTVTITVLDNNAQPITGELIYAQTILPGTTTYVTVSSATTGYDGKTVMNLKPYSYYKFVMYSSTGTLDFTSTPLQITLSAYTFTISQPDPILTNYQLVQSSSCQAYYNNATDNARFDWSVPTGSIVHACLNIQRITMTGTTTYSQSCTSSASGTILIPFAPTEGTYSLNGFISFGSTPTTPPYYPCGNPTIIDFGGTTTGPTKDIQALASARTVALFLSFLTLSIMMMIGIWSPIASIVLGTAAMLMLWITGMVSFGNLATSAPIIAGIITIAAILVYRMRTGYG